MQKVLKHDDDRFIPCNNMYLPYDVIDGGKLFNYVVGCMNIQPVEANYYGILHHVTHDTANYY